MKDTDLAWAAGFFDGEGSIGISRSKAKNGVHRYSLQVTITQKRLDSLRWLQSHFGGKISEKGTNGCHAWHISNEREKFLTSIFPFLREKREQAIVGLNFIQFLRKQKKTRSKPDGRFKAKTFFEVGIKNWYYWRLRELKKVA